MKKISFVMLLALAVTCVGVTSAQAFIDINGNIGVGEWVAPFQVNATDVNESGVENEHDIKLLLAQWSTVGGDIYIRTDLWGIPSLAKESGWLNDAYIAWQFDFNGDGNLDLSAQLIRETGAGHVDDAVHYYVGGIEYFNNGTKYWGMDSIYEVLIPDAFVPVFDLGKFQMRVISESASTSGDDNLPDSGWTDKVPEPSSMLMLGTGLMGLIGGAFRKKFAA